MNGAESLVHTLLANGVDTCFANPGTSEMHFVAALDRIPGMRCVLGLFEGVVTGAADGYARMAGKPAATLLHCGPGLANGLANLHNARRASTGIVNIVGDQATYHRPLDAPLTADTEGWARPVSGWVRTATHAATVGRDAAAAVQAARTAPGQIATLVLPADTAWTEGGVVAERLDPPARPISDPHQVAVAARVLRRGEPTLILLGGDALRAEPLETAHRIAAASGAKLMALGSNGRVERGRGRVPVNRIPYPVDQAVKALAEFRHVILVGARKPVIFFAYPNKPGSPVPPEAELHILARPEQDPPNALARLAEELGTRPAPLPDSGPRPEPVRGTLTPENVAQCLAALLPEQAVVADEAVTFGRGFFPATYVAAPHDWLQVTGGAIGGGMPLATGAAVGAPGRRVVNLQADGSGMYTLQALWTQAREKLDVTTVLFSNRKYAILIGELANVGANPGRTAMDMLDLGNPDLNWVGLANAMGVEAARAESCEAFADLFAGSVGRKGPFVIELVV
jgi:acetolactate synthase-1/2/3 large subunit